MVVLIKIITVTMYSLDEHEEYWFCQDIDLRFILEGSQIPILLNLVQWFSWFHGYPFIGYNVNRLSIKFIKIVVSLFTILD